MSFSQTLQTQTKKREIRQKLLQDENMMPSVNTKQRKIQKDPFLIEQQFHRRFSDMAISVIP